MLRTQARLRARFIDVELTRVQLVLGGQPVLRGIDWQIRPGQRWVLMGPNGAGKTQLLKLLAGDVWPTPSGDAARQYRLGREVFCDPRGIKEHIAYVGAERQDRYEHYDWNHRVEAIVGTGIYRSDIPLEPLAHADRARIARLLRWLRIESLARRRFLTLSYAERRLVLLARAVAWRPRLLLLDEPLTGLDAVNRERVTQCLKWLSRSLLPWVLATHRAQDIPAFATHLCRLEAGRIQEQGRLTARVRRALLPQASAGAQAPTVQVAAGKRAKRAKRSRTGKRGRTGSLLCLRQVTVWRDDVAVLRDISFDIRAGDCWVVHGSNGSGKSSLLQLLYGDLGAARGGSIVRAWAGAGVALEYFKRRVGLVAPELQAIHPLSVQVEEAVAAGAQASLGLSAAPSAMLRRRARRALRRVGAAALARRLLRGLSYGQLRRVLFARALVHEPDILLLDEPYSGLDRGTKAGLQALVQRAVASGVTVVLTTFYDDEWPRGVTHELELGHARARYCGAVRLRRATRRARGHGQIDR